MKKITIIAVLSFWMIGQVYSQTTHKKEEKYRCVDMHTRFSRRKRVAGRRLYHRTLAKEL